MDDVQVAEERGCWWPLIVWPLALVVPIALAVADTAFSQTSLATPINGVFQGAMQMAGLAFGYAWFVLTKGMITDCTPPLGNLTRCAVFMIAGLWLFNHGAWRLANYWEFGASSESYETAYHPIVKMSSKRRSRTATLAVDPAQSGTHTEIPIPEVQYAALADHYVDHCVAVTQRTSPTGAIEIVTDGPVVGSAPAAAVIGKCAQNPSAR